MQNRYWANLENQSNKEKKKRKKIKGKERDMPFQIHHQLLAYTLKRVASGMDNRSGEAVSIV